MKTYMITNTMKPSLLYTLLLATFSLWACSPSTPIDPYAGDGSAYDQEVATRADSLIRFYAENPGLGQLQAAARYHLNVDLERANEIMDSLALRQETDPSGDMFWMYPQTVAMFEGRGKMPEALMARQRNLWKI
jgi:hypothetical protein